MATIQPVADNRRLNTPGITGHCEPLTIRHPGKPATRTDFGRNPPGRPAANAVFQATANAKTWLDTDHHGRYVPPVLVHIQTKIQELTRVREIIENSIETYRVVDPRTATAIEEVVDSMYDTVKELEDTLSEYPDQSTHTLPVPPLPLQ